VHDLDDTLIGRLCVNVVVIVYLVLIVFIMYASIPSVFSMLLRHIHYPHLPMSVVISHQFILMWCLTGIRSTLQSLGIFREYDPFLDPYGLYPEDIHGKIMLTIAFNYSTDFSKAFDKLRKALIIIHGFMFGCSYLHSSELHA